MRDTVLRPGSLLARFLAAALLPLALVAGGSLTVGVPAQNPPKKPKVEEEEEAPAKPSKKPKEAPAGAKDPGKPSKAEEMEPVKKGGKKPPKVEDEEPGPAKPDTVTSQSTGLVQEAERTRNFLLRGLYLRLAVPHDLLVQKNGVTLAIAPFSLYVGDHPEWKNTQTFTPFKDPSGPSLNSSGDFEKLLAGKRAPNTSKQLRMATSPEVERIDPYEKIAVTEVDRFLKEVEGSPAAKTGLSRLEAYQGAEKVLYAVAKFHKDARDSRVREGTGWDEPRDKLEEKLLAVRLKELHEVAAGQDWLDTYALGARLAEEYAGKADVQARLVKEFAPFVERPLKEENYAEVGRRMKALEDLFAGKDALRPVNESLRAKAAELLQKAKDAKDNPVLAMRLVNQARDLSRDLPGLDEVQSDLDRLFPAIYVGVRHLPVNLSPATAYTDSERQAVEMLFEPLIRPASDPSHPERGQRYRPALAEELPLVIPLGRQFRLDPHAFWSNGRRVTAADVQGTVHLLRTRGEAELIDEPRVEGNSFQVSLTLHQGHLDPLGLMAFKVLPAAAQNLAQANDPNFAHQPVGSGPFAFGGRKDGEVVFVPNGHYHRPGKPGLRQVRFIHSEDPAADFQARHLHLLLDLPTAKIKDVKTIPGVKVHTLRNRRIYFLAVNHDRPNGLQDQEQANGGNPGLDLRRAIAYAIDRNKALNDFFRAEYKDDPTPPHRALNGPYPPGSWAFDSNANVKADLFDLGQAKALAARVPRKPTSLRLVYPANEPEVAQACEYIKSQVREATGIDLELEPLPPDKFHEKVEVHHEYDLAYCHFDYPNEAYWLGSLLDPDARALGGRNYLGYHNDAILEGYFDQALRHREFDKVRKATHSVHERVQDRLPFIPLWQLDTHLAIHKDLHAVDIDPLLIFTHVEDWTKNGR
jgi:ABC-type transport system substrate-binding protein